MVSRWYQGGKEGLVTFDTFLKITEFVVWVWMGSFLWTSLLNRKDLPVHPGLLIELLLKWRRFPIWFKLAITGTSSTENMFPFKEIQWPPSLVCHMYAIAERIHFPVLSYPLVV